MKIVAMATGGVGGNLVARLFQDGHTVSFIARGAHLKAIRTNGLTVTCPDRDFSIKTPHVTDDPAKVGPVDLIIFGTKAYDTISAAEAIKPMLGDKTVVLTVQNGVENAENIAKVIGKERVLVAPTEIVSNIIAPGVILQKSTFFNMKIGEPFEPGLSPRVQELVDAFRRVGVNAVGVEDGRVPCWEKLVFIASVAGLTTLARTAAHELLKQPEARIVLREAMEEIRSVAQAYGVPIAPDIVQRQLTLASAMKEGAKCSMHLDLEHENRLEVDALNGAAVRLGSAKSVPTPIHRTILAALEPHHLRACEAKK